MITPWRSDVRIIVTKHFTVKYLSRWNWDSQILTDAVHHAYRIEKISQEKYEVYVNKNGYKKIVITYDVETNTIVCITGSQGGYKI